MNKNVGRSTTNNDGLIYQAKSRVEKTEFGMRRCVIKFNLRNDKYQTLDPVRKTKCPDFQSGSPKTTEVLSGLDYLAAQTSTMNYDGVSPGIGQLEVACQGAIFTEGEARQSVDEVLIPDRGSGYTTAPTVNFVANDFQIAQATAHTYLRRSSVSFFVTPGTGYVVGDIIAYVGGTYHVQHMERVTQVDGSGGILAAVIHQRSEYTSVPANPVNISGGSGTGAQTTVGWEVGIVYVDSPGEYKFGPPPTVLFSGGTTGRTATALAVMGSPHSGTELNFTLPFDPVTTVKDTVEFSIFQPASLTGTQLSARVANDFVAPTYPAVLHNPSYFGYNTVYGAGPGALPPVDGVSLNVNDRLLLTNGTPLSGLYFVLDLGAPDRSFYLARVPEMDASAEFNNTTFVNVAEGVNSGVWQCTVAASFALETDNVTFEKSGVIVPTLAIGKKVTLDYHAIELHFEYMSRLFQSRPRYIQVEYSRNSNGEIVLDAIVTPQVTMKLEVDEVSAISQSQITDSSGNVTILDGPPVAITDEEWLNAIKYVGTSAQFEQIPAGAVWHVTEQTTIKVQAIVPVGHL